MIALHNYNKSVAGFSMSNNIAAPLSYPTDVWFVLTDVCNQHCRFCCGDHKKPSEGIYGDLSGIKTMVWLKYVSSITIIGHGEALCHPDYVTALQTIRKLAPDSDIRLYTNGLALNGKRLDATLECANKIAISQNAITKKAHESVILNSNYEQAMRNLKELSNRKPKNLDVNLGIVMVKETVGELRKMIDIAGDYGFNSILMKKGRFNGDHSEDGLPEDSYFIDYADYFDMEEMKRYAESRKVSLFDDDAEEQRTSACAFPWNELRFVPAEKGWGVQVCCRKKPNLFTSLHDFSDVWKIWNHERF